MIYWNRILGQLITLFILFQEELCYMQVDVFVLYFIL